MLLRYANGDTFATGATPYLYRPVTEKETSPRVILTVLIDSFETLAFVDTGGIFLIAPEVALHLGLDPNDGVLAQSLLWRNDRLQGMLHRVSLTLPAEVGNSLTIDATAFVPQLAPHQEWSLNFQCVLGMLNCLERLRFAVDPSSDTFYFGELAPD
jgi:hypothetical protein